MHVGRTLALDLEPEQHICQLYARYNVKEQYLSLKVKVAVDMILLTSVNRYRHLPRIESYHEPRIASHFRLVYGHLDLDADQRFVIVGGEVSIRELLDLLQYDSEILLVFPTCTSQVFSGARRDRQPPGPKAFGISEEHGELLRLAGEGRRVGTVAIGEEGHRRSWALRTVVAAFGRRGKIFALEVCGGILLAEGGDVTLWEKASAATRRTARIGDGLARC